MERRKAFSFFTKNLSADPQLALFSCAGNSPGSPCTVCLQKSQCTGGQHVTCSLLRALPTCSCLVWTSWEEVSVMSHKRPLRFYLSPCTLTRCTRPINTSQCKTKKSNLTLTLHRLQYLEEYEKQQGSLSPVYDQLKSPMQHPAPSSRSWNEISIYPQQFPPRGQTEV